MKKILSLTLAFIFVFSLCACQKIEGEASSLISSKKESSSEIQTSSKQVSSKESEQTLDAQLEESDEGVEVLNFVKTFSRIPIGYASMVENDHSSFLDKENFKNVDPLEMAMFLCYYLEDKRILWSDYQGTFGYEGYRVPAKDLNIYAERIFGYEYDFSKIKETNCYGTINKYIPSSKAFDVGIFGSIWQNGACEYKGIYRKIGDNEYRAKFIVWEKVEKPDEDKGLEWYKYEKDSYWEYEDTYVLTVKRVYGEWKYISFVEM